MTDSLIPRYPFVRYQFSCGQRVGYAYECRYGVVVDRVPGNGSIEWYFVEWEDGTPTDRYTSDQLRPV